jgi:lipoyl(octanoyl) transferase
MSLHVRADGSESLRELWIVELGMVPWERALGVQRALAAARITGEVPQDVLLLCEHPPVVTRGRSSRDARHLRLSANELAARGCSLHEAERGGDVTFHGPGQLVGYPIVDLKRHRQDLHWHLRQLEAAIIQASAEVGIEACRNPGFTGVWVGDRKLASIGVHARDWVTWHGFALNVTTDLSWFDVIVPCGLNGVAMTSWAAEGQSRSVAAAGALCGSALAAVFALTPRVMRTDHTALAHGIAAALAPVR